LENMETAIANGRRYYNACVVNLNNKIDMFPSSIVASHYHIERAQMFELADMAARKNVKVEF